MAKNPVNKSLDNFIHKNKKKLTNYYEKNFSTKDSSENYGVSIIMVTMRQNCMQNIFDNYKRQDFEKKEMILVLNNNNLNINEWLDVAEQYENVTVFQLDEKITLGNCLNFGILYSKYDFIAKFDDDDYYGPKYLSDLIKAFDIVDADVVGKKTSFVYFEKSKTLAVRNPENENKYVKHMDGPTLLIRKKVFNRVRFANIPRGVDTQFSKDCVKNGFKIYSTNKYHHVYVRHDSLDKHTWKIKDEDLLKYCIIVEKDVRDYTTFVNI
ncbi:glycosyltransferase [Clostridium sp. Cult2]|uniref:glycosyltransferase n=1 Tax=Clostridium sp. Cult2 TaxID=2079003 RepID=UPI001F450687|nr:glycosyltransferase [Clostridium sp. Cult2]MCF6465679.1 glycosyl transferase family 2 [Clostridium sp. Cult2]